MKRILINAACFAVVALGSTQLAAPASAAEFQSGIQPAKTPYQTCMDYCMPEGWGFHHCHADCTAM
jgi:hypothetical protein